MLSVLNDGDWTVPRVARRLGVSRQAVQRIVDALHDDELVGLKTNPGHERSSLPHLTERRREALGLITNEARRWHQHIADGLALGDLVVTRAALANAMRDIARAVVPDAMTLDDVEVREVAAHA